jgi:primosomal protein N' (replication factor Y)
MVFVQIAVNVPSVTGVFDYHLAPDLEGRVGAGHLVTAPFGKQTVQGVVLQMLPRPSVPETKAVLDLLDPEPVLTAAQIALAHELAGASLNPLAQMVGLMLPPGLAQHADGLYALAEGGGRAMEGGQWTIVQRRLLALLQKRGGLRGRQIDRHFHNVDWRKSAQALVRIASGTTRFQPATSLPGSRLESR